MSGKKLPPNPLRGPPVDGDDKILALHQRLSELEARNASRLRSILALEKGGNAARGGDSADLAQAKAMLQGELYRFQQPEISELDSLYAERKVVKRAIELGNAEHYRLLNAREQAIWASHSAEIAALEKRRVMCALELESINRARETLRQKIGNAGGVGFLSTDGVEIVQHDDIRWSCDRLVADGIATRAELDKASKA
jgi:hypothetical protein